MNSELSGSGRFETGTPAARKKQKSNPVSVPDFVSGSLKSHLLLFHEPWWLATAAGDQHVAMSAVRGEGLSGQLSLIKTRSRLGFRILRMPYLTHVLGPMIRSSNGKRQKRMSNRLSLIRDLLDQLPPYDFCQFTMDPTLDEGLALGDGLAFQEYGFRISPQYTFRIPCQTPLDDLWAGLDFRVRQHVRRAGERYTISEIDDPDYFVKFYLKNVRKRGRQNYFQFERFPLLFSECKARSCGIILAANLPNGSPAAMTFLVWGHGVLYYTLSTRVPDSSESGCVNLLIWSAIKKANELGLICDLDGVVSRGIGRFLGGFGGEIAVRLVATHARSFYGAIRSMTTRLDSGAAESSRFS